MRFNKLLALSIMVLLLPAARCSESDKDAAQDTTVVASAIAAAAAAFFAGPVGAGAVIVLQGAGLIVAGELDDSDSSQNKPDPNFNEVATVTPVVFTKVAHRGTVDPLADDVNESLTIAGQMIDNVRLLNISLRRFYGARSAGNAVKAELQRNAACDFLFKLDANLLAYHDVLLRISSNVQGTRFALISVTFDDVRALRDQIVRERRFPDFEASVFSEARATPEEISRAIREVELANLNTLNASDLTGAAIFSRAARVIDRVSAQGFLPDDFVCGNPAPPPLGAPTLSEWGTIIMVLLMLMAGIIFIVRRHPAIAKASMTGGAAFNEEIKQPLFVPTVFCKVCAVIIALGVLAGTFISLLDVSISVLDIGGMLLCMLILSYVIHLLISASRNSSMH
jgi:hypothetical protein